MAEPLPFSPRRIPDRVRSWHPDRIVDDLLLADETVFRRARPDWWVVAFDQLGLAVLGVVVALVVALQGWLVAAVLILVSAAGWVLWRIVDSWYTRYVLTDFRVLRTSGVLERNVEFIPWRKVTDVSLRRSFWQRLVGASTIRIESANEASRFRAMTDVQDPREFFRVLQEVMAAYAGHVEL